MTNTLKSVRRVRTDLAVIDTSVVAKWFVIRNELFLPEANALLARFNVGELAIAAPVHLAAEVPSIITKAMQRRELTLAEALAAHSVFERLSSAFAFYRGDDLDRRSISLCATLRCSFYDGLYLALAEELECPFIHADARLRKAIAGRSPRELWIQEVSISDVR
jgi:predicted nucleic acid-binding protein